MPTSLPPYLTSGASSRAHHSLLVRLHSAASQQEEEALLSVEIRSCRDVLETKGKSTTKVAETLLVLLHVSMIRHTTDESLDFALVPALKLAEGGRTLRERQIGYLYLGERMWRDDERGVLLINTIRKDLSSSKVPELMLALGTIVKLPSPDLEPAVTPLLVSKTLLRHHMPAVRQRVLEALVALHLHDPDISQEKDVAPSFPLSMSNLVRILGAEEDGAVLAVLLRIIRDVLHTRVHKILDEEERGFLVQQVVEAARRNEVGVHRLLGNDILRLFGHIVRGASGESVMVVVDWAKEQLEKIKLCTGWAAAFVLEASTFLGKLDIPRAPIHDHILVRISTLLFPPSSSSTPTPPLPDSHGLALRCLLSLSRDTWDGYLGEAEMEVIMEGLNSPDDTIRRLTLQLLQRLSPELLDLSFINFLESLRTSTNLSLPLGIALETSLEEKLRLGRHETAGRALEVVEIQVTSGGRVDDAEMGQTCGRAVRRLLEVMHELFGEEGGGVWEDGVRRVLDFLQRRPRAFDKAFTESMFQHSSVGISSTLSVIRATLASEYTQSAERGIQTMLDDIPGANASVQELIMVAIVSLLARKPESSSHVIERLRIVAQQSSKYIRKRCQQVVSIIEQDLLEQVMVSAKTSSMPDILNAIISVHGSSAKRSKASSSPSPSIIAKSPIISASRLRYDAYKAPAVPKSRRPSQSVYKDRPSVRGPGAEGGKALDAGDYTLFDADSETDSHLADPFAIDENGTPRPG